jgi:hypothetical protein
MGTPMASSAGLLETSTGREKAAALPTIPTITNKAARATLLTIFLTNDVIFLVANMAFISLATCIR